MQITEFIGRNPENIVFFRSERGESGPIAPPPPVGAPLFWRQKNGPFGCQKLSYRLEIVYTDGRRLL